MRAGAVKHVPRLPTAEALELLVADNRQARAAAAARESRNSWARLGVFLGGLAAAIALGRVLGPWTGVGVFVAALVLFIFVVRRHLLSVQVLQRHERQHTVLQESQRRVAGEIVALRGAARPAADAATDAAVLPLDDAERGWPLTAQEEDDLDLFAAPVGLFGLLNRTSTGPGARRLARALCAPLLDAPQIARRQAAARALAEAHGPRIALLGALASLRGEDRRLANFVRAVASARGALHRWSPTVLRGYGVFCGLLLIAVLIATFNWTSQAGWVLAPLLIVNGVLRQSAAAPAAETNELWSDVQPALDGVAEVCHAGAAHTPDVEPLVEIRRRLALAEASQALPALARACGWTQTGGLVRMLANYLVLYDLQVAATLDRQASRAKDQLLAAVSALRELDFLLSLACFAAEQGEATWPQLHEAPGVSLENARHPLLDVATAVPNSMRLDDATRIWVVTGSNMAGKSTFLRMTAANLLLAQLGTKVVARRCVWQPVALLTDLRASDSLAAGESYFLSEVRHIRRLLAARASPQRVFGIIDEPFRGTNTVDQSAASVAVLEYLRAVGHYILLATHDRRLTECADEQVVRNYHFEENLTDVGLTFDYALRAGPARTRNALRVLEQEGYPAEVLAAARRWLAEAGHEDPRTAV